MCGVCVCVVCVYVWGVCPRLQTGMRGAFGKPLGTVARVNIGQVIMSVRTKAGNKEHVVEALRRAKFKFPGRQKVHAAPLSHTHTHTHTHYTCLCI